MKRCIYCGYAVGNTTEHLLPKSIIRNINIYDNVSILRPNDSRNIAPACKFCNNKKSSEIYFPTLAYIHSVYKNMPVYNLCDFADYLFEHEFLIHKYLTSCEKLNNGLIYTKLRCDWDNFIFLYNLGYFDFMRKLYKDEGR